MITFGICTVLSCAFTSYVVAKDYEKIECVSAYNYVGTRSALKFAHMGSGSLRFDIYESNACGTRELRAVYKDNCYSVYKSDKQGYDYYVMYNGCDYHFQW